MSWLAELPYWGIYFQDVSHCKFLRLSKRSSNNTSDCYEKVVVLTSSNGIFFTKNCHDFPFLPYLIRLTNRCAMAQTDAPISIPANMSIKLSLCSSKEILFFFMFLSVILRPPLNKNNGLENGSGLLLGKHPLEKLNTPPSIGLGVHSLLFTHPE